ncbi:MAG: energy transducer TonB [Silvibacterium sp.]|nr:energy transducer TonB [Silvibacterium sp.]
MLVAADVNGLSSPDLKPWHLEATYQTFDENGQPKDQGKFEEWWAGAEKYKLSYTSTGFNQVEFRNGAARFFTGERTWPPSEEAAVHTYLTRPLHFALALKVKFSEGDVSLGGVDLRCLRPVADGGSAIPSVYPAFCISKDHPAVRAIVLNAETQIFFDKIVRFGEQYVAEQIFIKHADKPQVSISVTELNSIATVVEADLAPPPDAVPAPARKVTLSPGVVAGGKISGYDPVFPPIARAAHVEGVVVIAVTISKTGTLTNLHVISGPPMLQQSALDAVKTWRYKPYLLNGETVEVETQINVVFKLPLQSDFNNSNARPLQPPH